jgi:hypothetical protein
LKADGLPTGHFYFDGSRILKKIFILLSMITQPSNFCKFNQVYIDHVRSAGLIRFGPTGRRRSQNHNFNNRDRTLIPISREPQRMDKLFCDPPDRPHLYQR